MLMSRRGKIKRFGFFSKLLLVINILAIAGILISYLAPYIDPNLFWPIAFFGILYPIFLFINLLFIVYWAIRQPIFATLSVIAIAIGWGAFRKHVGLKKQITQNTVALEDSTRLRIMSYNVHFFSPPEETSNNFINKKAIFNITDSISPDILCFQEYLTREKGEHNITKTLTEKSGYTYHYFHATNKNEYEAYGLAIFSKWPIINSGKLEKHQYGVNSIIYADIAKGKDTVRVYNIHLRTFGLQQEDYDFINASPNSQSFGDDVSSTKRIGWRLKQAYLSRSKQAKSLSDHSISSQYPLFIVGDFNDTPLSFAVNHVGKQMLNAFREKGNGWGKTYNGAFPNFQIDYILTSNKCYISNFQIINKKLSDHYPIWADIYLPSSGK